MMLLYVLMATAAVWVVFDWAFFLVETLCARRARRARLRRYHTAMAHPPPSVPVQPWPYWAPPVDPSNKSPRPYPRPDAHGTPARGIPLSGPYRRRR